MDTLKRTPLYKEHVKLGANMVPFVGFEMPIVYTSMIEEHMAVRDHAGIFDVSHMGEIFIEGKDALAFTDYLITNKLSNANKGDIKYSAMLYEEGGEVDDLLAYKINDEKVLLVVNASNIEKDYAHILTIKESRPDLDCTINNTSDQWGQVALQGPKAAFILQKNTPSDLETMKKFTFQDIAIGGIDTVTSRTGYTGEDGFEILAPKDQIATLWKLLLQTGEKEGILPCGLGSRDTLRFESCLWLYGNDIDSTTNPIEAGQGFAVKLDKDFVGKKVCQEAKEKGPQRKLTTFEVNSKMIPRHGYSIYSDGKEIGQVTSGSYCPKIEKVCAMGYIPADLSVIGNVVQIKIRNKEASATIVKKPFYKNDR
ncbi:MAG: glycine cleavage system aminomethyltransferase GcvT [Caldisericia bacterium]|nr:glycine cleavage system aminomethyltransferase GcvT [Caldisericia bacterium]